MGVDEEEVGFDIFEFVVGVLDVDLDVDDSFPTVTVRGGDGGRRRALVGVGRGGSTRREMATADRAASGAFLLGGDRDLDLSTSLLRSGCLPLAFSES